VIITNARRSAALAAGLLTMAVLVGPAWSEPRSFFAISSARAIPESPSGAEGPRPKPDSFQPTGVDALAIDLPAPIGGDPDLSLLTASVANREPTDLRLLLANGERWRLVEFGAAATWRPLTAKVTAFGQLPYVAADPTDRAAAFDGAHDPASLGVKGEVEGFEAGAQYRSVGKRLERLIGAPTALNDREGYELWAAQRLGLLRLRLSDSELTDNVDRNPALPRTTKDQTAVTAGVAIPEWPVFELTYASGDSSRVRLTPEGREGTPERYDFESVKGSASYHGGPAWDLIASSTFSQSRHVVRTQEETATTAHDLSLTLRLLESFTAVPTLSVGQERYTWSAVRSDTGTAGLTVSYAPPATGWSASTFASYTATRTSDRSIDGRSVSLSAATTWSLGRWLPKGSTVSFEAGYDRYVDGVVPASSSRAISGFVLLRIAGF
jgi:hypothetical protein